MTAQQFNLRWNNHTNNLLQVFADQFEREQMVDVTISCQGKFIKAHKMILGACSPYFQEIFDRHGSTPHPVIIMNGLKIDDIRAIVEFMYKGEVKVCESDLESLLATAENLQIKGLSNVRATRQGQSNNSSSSPTNTTFSNNSNNQSYQSSETTGNRNSSSGSTSFGSGNNSNHSSSGRSNSSQSNEKGNEESLGTPLHLRRRRNKTTSPNKDVKDSKNDIDAQSLKNENSSSCKSSVLQDASVDDENSNDLLPMTIRIDPPYIRDIDEEDEVDESSISEPCDGIGQDGKVNSVTMREIGMPVSAVMGFPPEPKEKIPRPPNSFMIFANEWRRKLATQFPNESNKEISVRLGIMWKNLSGDSKEEYFAASRQANEDHKRKYPDYYYSPKEARLRKRWKMQQQQVSNMMSSGQYNPVHLVKVFINEEDGEGDRKKQSNSGGNALHHTASTH